MHWLSGDLLYVAEKRKEVSVVGIGGLSRIKKISSLDQHRFDPSSTSTIAIFTRPGKTTPARVHASVRVPVRTAILRISTHPRASVSGVRQSGSGLHPRFRAGPFPDCILRAFVPLRTASCASTHPRASTASCLRASTHPARVPLLIGSRRASLSGLHPRAWTAPCLRASTHPARVPLLIASA